MMSILPIITYNDPVLRKKTDRVEANSEDLQTFIDDMLETMYNANGVGLAAPQVGRTLQLFVMDADSVTEDLDEPDLGPMVFINPEIIERSEETVKMEEGCLSIPALRDDVQRSERVVVSWMNRELEKKQMEFSGWHARVIQHEYDHLQGILFLDHLSVFRTRLHRSALQKIDEGLQETDYPLVSKAAKSI